MEIKNYEEKVSQNCKKNETDLYDMLEVLIRQKLVMAAVIILSIIASSFLVIKENKSYKAKTIAKFTEISKQKLKFEKTEAKLIEVENRIQNIISEESKAFTTVFGISEFIALKYSTILREKKELEIEYEKQKENLKTIDNPIRNKSKLILVSMTIFGVFLGVFAAFFKEFIEGYKKRK